MNDINIRADRISRYQARLKHIDELLERAHQQETRTTEHETALKEITGKREKLADYIGELKHMDPSHWQEQEIEKSGPMALWDSVAQQLEKLVE
ncbi:MAG: hypothetical protein PVH16_03890, partial [Thioalkalispiraceae bacterium]